MARKPAKQPVAQVAAPEPSAMPKRRSRAIGGIPIRFLLPNLLTLLALCSGVTAIRFAVEGRFELAVGGIIFAVVLDGFDGRLARYLKGTSRFGAELDSLADFVNFGVAPAILVYFWSLNWLSTFGWVVCLMLSIACALRLARFNVALDDPDKPAWAASFFTGMPAPAGAVLSLAPLYLGFLGILTEGHSFMRAIAAYEILVAVLMVSRVPTFSGKTFTRVPREFVLPFLALMVLFVVFLISYPWETLAALSALYLLMIPVSVASYRRHKRAKAG
ncbi:CDP-alcohol phosphatidyltransferase family protein [Aestuariivirga litoralis]|uniref:CDP-alcohol phosphatidyltransferase family protein n=1 Tax=Aestuariivirga litoralis TaxID=2650924 RepID=UPI0018C84539|nr:phosphatidylcholine/phosphatidylserine synthase [Aestuariivirga litoralis]MBG1232074.1 phosphatidylcholine/phosphatidylserine synthase [Aestuariivirga litoralis]